MRTSTATSLRLFAAAMLALLLSFVLPSTTQAQLCNCDYVTVIVDASVCNTVIVQPSGLTCRFDTVHVQPGETRQVPCCEDMQLTIYACNGNDQSFLMNGVVTCVTPIPIAPGCCVEACAGLDPSGKCPVLYIRRSAQKCPFC